MLYKVKKYVPLILRYYKEPNNFKAFIKQVYQKEWRQNNNKEKEQNNYFK